MEPGSSPGSWSSETPPDFAFAFNDPNFSDRVLRIEILPDSEPDPDDSFAARYRKRRRDNQLSDANATVLTMQHEEQVMSNVLDLDDGVAYENQEEEALFMTEEPPVGVEKLINHPDHEATQGVEISSVMDYSAVQVKTIHISSPILAAKSPFFYKLFSNGTNESGQRHVTIQIHASDFQTDPLKILYFKTRGVLYVLLTEEAALMDLLNFIYGNCLTRTTPSALLDVLMAADKYEVASCMRYCSQLLRNIPMTCESAVLYLDLPSIVLMADTVQPLVDTAKQFLAFRFKDINKFEEEVMNLPLSGIEAVLASDDLQVASEDAIMDFVLKWARAHYPTLEERREILSTRLVPWIRFPCMTCRKLKKVLTCSDFDPEIASKIVLDALFFKAEVPFRQRILVAEEANSSYHHYMERAYKYRPAKVIEFDSPRQHGIVYLDLKREECANLFPSGRVYSQAFHLGGQGFFLSAHCNIDQQSSVHCFGLFLGMQEKGSAAFTVDYEFASRTKPSEEFVSKYKGNYTFTGGKAVGYRNLFGMPWTVFIEDDSLIFINGILHLRAELTVK